MGRGGLQRWVATWAASQPASQSWRGAVSGFRQSLPLVSPTLRPLSPFHSLSHHSPTAPPPPAPSPQRHFKRLAELSQDKSLSSRVRFLVRDILDLRANKWVPRREVQTAKKLDEIRAEAELALGVSIPKTDAGAGSFASLAPRGGQREVELFPALREGGAAGQGRYTHRTGAGEVASGLLGDFVPRATPPAATGNVNRSDEELEKMMRGMIEEFVAVGDEKELVTCMNDLNNPAWMPKVRGVWVRVHGCGWDWRGDRERAQDSSSVRLARSWCRRWRRVCWT